MDDRDDPTPAEPEETANDLLNPYVSAPDGSPSLCSEVKVHAQRNGMVWTVRVWALHRLRDGTECGRQIRQYETPALERDGREVHPSEVVRRAVYQPSPMRSTRPPRASGKRA